ncbi:hypothetical protein FHX60_000262 [Cupriavidus alkaliphilus]|nr:hypothetical protein [Cupriavidus alkaliphilus]
MKLSATHAEIIIKAIEQFEARGRRTLPQSFQVSEPVG